jgi:ribonuclease P protein component
MLPQENRLTEKIDFDEVKEKGKIVQSDSFAFAYLAKKAGNPSRFGFVVSTKISKAATLRNRVKRALREAVRQNIFYTKKGIDGVFLAKTAILKKSTPEIMNEVKQILASNKIV